MKICFFLQRRFAFIGHDIIIHLKNKYGFKNFCAYVMNRPSYRFLTSQKDIDYSTLLLDEDLDLQAKKEKLDLDYIKFLEKEYGLPNLWPYIEVDRVLRLSQLIREYPMDKPSCSHEEMMIQIQVRAKAIIKMLEKEKPDYLFATVVGGIGGFLLFNIAKKMGVKVRMILPARVGTRYTISETYDSFSEIDKEFDQLVSSSSKVSNYDEAKKTLDDFKDNPKTYANIIDFYRNRTGKAKQLDFFLPSKLKIYFKWLFGRIHYFFTQKDKHDYTYIKTWQKIKDQVARKLRTIRGINDLYDEIDPDSEDFAFFPLHLEPETALLLSAYWHTKQLEVIRQIARSLPIHFKFYVKEHPRMVGFRTRWYYKELKKIPNVKLVNPSVNSLQLIPKSKLVTVITGSVGWEALMLKIPVITFGGIFFNKLSMVKRCHSYEKLPDIVKDQLENFQYNEQELVNYIGLVLKNSAFIDLQRAWFREPDVVKRRADLVVLADLIAKHVKQ